MKTMLEKLRDEARTHIKKAREVAEKASADNRSMTTTEQSEYDDSIGKAKDLLPRIQAAQADQKVLDDASALFAELGPVNDDAAGAGSSRIQCRERWAKSTAAALTKAMRSVDGQKALVSGTIGVANIIDPTIVGIERVPTAILDLVNLVSAKSDGSGGNSFTFLRQTVRDNNAAVVADGDDKPTSIYTIEEVEDRFRVVAHLSEPIPQRYFADDQQLEDFLRSEMGYGLELALEEEILAGDGTGEHMTGILETSGIVTQAFVTDIFTSTRKALTTMQSAGNVPTGFAMHPTDIETVDLAQDANDQYYGDGPFAGGASTLWKIPLVPSVAITPGQAVLGDWRTVDVPVRQNAEVAVDVSGDNFKKNLATMRVEGRFGVAVKRPSAFAVIDLTA